MEAPSYERKYPLMDELTNEVANEAVDEVTNEVTPEVMQEMPPVRRQRRKRSKFQIFKETYLPLDRKSVV